MVNVKSVIFFGKSEKNIWVLDFFNYNHKYETVKQIKQSAQFITDLFMEQYHRATAEQFITAKHLEQYHSQNSHNTWNSIIVKTVITDTTAITPTT